VTTEAKAKWTGYLQGASALLGMLVVLLTALYGLGVVQIPWASHGEVQAVQTNLETHIRSQERWQDTLFFELREIRRAVQVPSIHEHKVKP
jgi:hypothetical protein